MNEMRRIAPELKTRTQDTTYFFRDRQVLVFTLKKCNCMADYIPSADADFHLWQTSFISIMQPQATAWGILAADVTALVGQQTIWTAAFTKASNKQNRTAADVQAKDDARKAYEKALRNFVAQWVASNAKVPNSERERMGLTVKSGTHTAVPVPSTSPVVSVDFSKRLKHTVSYVDETGSKAKPQGVHGCEIWWKVGDEAPKDASELHYLATDTASPYVVSFEGKDAGKTVYYWLRWVNTRGELGSWSNPASAMVVG
jgi:hypothetical protein